jgi:valyl-tRNA synthetase
MKTLQEVIVQTRTIRTENKIPPHRKVGLWLKPLSGADRTALDGRQDYILSLANLSTLKLMDDFPDGRPLLKGIGGGFELAIPQDEELDAGQEKLRLEKELSKINLEIEKLAQRLGTASFVERAPRAVVEEVRAKLLELEQKKAKTEEHLSQVFGVK